MKFDEKALEAAGQALFDNCDRTEDAYPEGVKAAIEAYCNAAGVVMVERETVEIIGKHWSGSYFKGVNTLEAEDIDRRISEMVLASHQG